MTVPISDAPVRPGQMLHHHGGHAVPSEYESSFLVQTGEPEFTRILLIRLLREPAGLREPESLRFAPLKGIIGLGFEPGKS
jgi:hypothetical protein